jgi:hypothetical protein
MRSLQLVFLVEEIVNCSSREHITAPAGSSHVVRLDSEDNERT